MQGMSRGTHQRLCDICENPEKYMLLCIDCHYKYDAKRGYAWYSFRGVIENEINNDVAATVDEILNQ